MRFGGGPGGGAIFLGEKGKIIVARDEFSCEPAELADDPIGDGEIQLAKSDNHMQNWFDCMKSRERPIADVEIGHRSATVCHLANIARWLGRKLQWDPNKEEFVSDDQANQMRSRSMRAPWHL